jgi:hypothetical protein
LKKLFAKLLHHDPSKRPSVREIIQLDEWMNDVANMSTVEQYLASMNRIYMLTHPHAIDEFENSSSDHACHHYNNATANNNESIPFSSASSDLKIVTSKPHQPNHTYIHQ